MQIGGWLGVFVAAIAYYIAFAELTNECYRKASRCSPLSAWMSALGLAVQIIVFCRGLVFLEGLPRQASCLSKDMVRPLLDICAEALLGAQKIMPLGEMRHRFALPENTEEREDII